MSETQPAFSVRPVYDPHTDSLMVYLADVPSYAKDLGNGVSVFLAADDGRVVGVEISGVASTGAVAKARPALADYLFRDVMTRMKAAVSSCPENPDNSPTAEECSAVGEIADDLFPLPKTLRGE